MSHIVIRRAPEGVRSFRYEASVTCAAPRAFWTGRPLGLPTVDVYRSEEGIAWYCVPTGERAHYSIMRALEDAHRAWEWERELGGEAKP